MKLGLLLALLPSLAFGQTKTADSFRMDRLEILVNSLISGKPTTTSFMNMVGSITFLTEGAGITWGDGTISTSAFGSTGSGITQLTGDVTAGPGSGSKVATIANLAVTGAKMANATITDTQVSAISESKITNLTGDLSRIATSTANIASATTTINSSMVTQFAAVGVSTTNIAASTTTLYTVKASTGYDNSLTRAGALTLINSSATVGGTLTVGGNGLSVGGSSFTVTGGSATVAYQASVGSLKLGNTASGTQCLHADGSGNVTGTGADCGSGSGGGGGSSTGTIAWQIDNFLGQANGSQKAFVLSNVASSTGALIVVLDGLLQSSASDYTYDGVNTVTMTTAPAANSSSFFAQYTINTSTLAAAMLTNSTDTVTAPKVFLATITVTNLIHGTTDNLLDISQGAYWARSIDGATQSSGCLVAVSFNSGASDAELVFTSTTSNLVPVNSGITAGVLLDPSCAPGRMCRVGINGIYRVNVGAIAGSGRWCGFNSTRCQVECSETTSSFVVGHIISNQGGTTPLGMHWLRLGFN